MNDRGDGEEREPLGFALTFPQELIEALAEAVADRLKVHVEGDALAGGPGEWLDTRHAAAYVGIHRDTLAKLAREGKVSSAQEGPGCKRYFRRAVLDGLRTAGPSSPASTLLPLSREPA